MPVKRILSGALAALLIAAIPARATSVPTFTLVDSIAPGADDSYAMAINQSVALGNYLYFVAETGTSGSELWRSNGTTTQLVKDINPGTPSSYPSNFAVLGDYLYFQANDGTHGVELWRTNGSEAGTTLVKDIAPGISASDPLALTVFSDYIYFQAHDATSGHELWRSDGTEAGTTLVEDIRVGSDGSFPYNFYAWGDMFGDYLFFNASDGTTGNELWVYEIGGAPTSSRTSLKEATATRLSSKASMGTSTSGPTMASTALPNSCVRTAPRRAPRWSRTFSQAQVPATRRASPGLGTISISRLTTAPAMTSNSIARTALRLAPRW